MTEPQNPDARPQPYAPSAPTRGNAAAVTAFIVAVALVVIGFVQVILTHLIPQMMVQSGASAAEVGLVLSATSAVTGMIAIVGVIAGIIGIQPTRSRGRLLAAAGLAVSAAHVLSVLMSFGVSAAFGILG